MLKINKILSKKIKSPPSLRGANRRSNLNGFSLIELMIAVAILAMAIFGIFHAYSVGFMGMADARDRTVATNYLREIMEDYKNMDFKKVKDEPITLIPGTKFSRGAIVLELKENLKRVIAQVRWSDRKENIITEKASTVLYRVPKSGEVSTAVGIVLYASPYYTILPEGSVAIIAEIKDSNGNTMNNWVGDIGFSILSSNPIGFISTDSVSTTDGTASIVFNVNVGTSEGIEKIEASANLENIGEVTDTVNIRVSTGAVGIILEPAEGNEIPITEGTATINVTVVKADYHTTIAYDSPITLSAVGPGTLSETTIDSVSKDGYEFYLTSNGTPGKVEITASAPDLDMGYTEVTFTGEANSILVSSEENSIYPGEKTTITVTIVDENNTPVGFSGIVTIAASPYGYGDFFDDDGFGVTSLKFEGDSSSKYCFFKANTPIDFLPEENKILIEINVSYDVSGEELIPGSTTIEILKSLEPHHIELFIFPTSIDIVNGEISTITAIICDAEGNTVTNYSGTITFTAKDEEGIDFGDFDPDKVVVVTPEGIKKGEAEVILSSNFAGVTTVTVSSSDFLPFVPEGGIPVVFYDIPHHIVLYAYPLTVQANGTDKSIISARVVDEWGNKVTNYKDPITFSNDPEYIGNFTEKNGVTPVDGVATVGILSEKVVGDTVVTASSGDLSDNGPVLIEFIGETSTKVTLGEVTNLGDFNISFVITIIGSQLNLGRMEIEWDDSGETLDNITITSPYPDGASPLSIDTTGTYSPCITSEIDKTLVVGESEIKLSFNIGSIMDDKNITVTFINESSEEFIVSFLVPDSNL